MQTITVNSQYDVSNNLIDYDLLFEELELCFKTCSKTFYVRPKALVANQFYNENGKAIKRAPACWKYYEDVFESRYSKILVEAMKKRGFECRKVNMHYLDRKSVKDLSHNNKSNEFLLCIFFDEEEPSVFDFQDAWEEELKNLFPTSCKFKFEKDLIVFTIPEFE